MIKTISNLLSGFSVKSYLYIGLAFAAIAFTSTVLTKTYLAGKHTAELKFERDARKAEVALLNLKLGYTQLRVQINEDALLKEQQQAALDDEEAAKMKARIDELQAQLSSPDAVCFGGDDTRRLQELFGATSPDNPQGNGAGAP